MMFGKVLRATGYNATLDSIDTSAAEKMPGVKLVRDGDFIGVVAPDAWTAEEAIASIQAKWTVPPQPSNTEHLRLPQEPTPSRRAAVRAPAQPASRSHRASSRTPRHRTRPVLHRPVHRARSAGAPRRRRPVGLDRQAHRLDRDPASLRRQATSSSLPSISTPRKVRVIQPDMGSGYGGKHTGEAAVEAARLAKAAGAPVRLVWTREEEFTWAYFRPAGLMELKASVQPDGTLVAWEHHNYNSGNAGLAHAV